MIVAIISLLLNIALNYLLAFFYGFGHVGLAIASSISALVSVCILTFLLWKESLISLQNVLSFFTLKVFIASYALVGFLVIFNQYFDFEMFSEFQRLLHLSGAIIGSLFIYFGVSFILGIRASDFR